MSANSSLMIIWLVLRKRSAILPCGRHSGEYTGTVFDLFNEVVPWEVKRICRRRFIGIPFDLCAA